MPHSPAQRKRDFGKIEVLRAVWDVNARDVTYEPPLAFAAGRLGVLEIGRKLQIRLRNSKPPYLQVAKAINLKSSVESLTQRCGEAEFAEFIPIA